MKGKDARIEDLVIMEVLCNVTSLAGVGTHPEEFLRRIGRLQRAVALPFKTMSIGRLTEGMNMVRVSFPTDMRDVEQALWAYLCAIDNVQRLSEEMLPDFSLPLGLSAGMVSGRVLLRRGEPLGVTANVADAFASEAHRTGVALFIGWSLFKAMKFDACLEVAPKTIRVTGGRDREVVGLSKSQVRTLAEG